MKMLLALSVCVPATFARAQPSCGGLGPTSPRPEIFVSAVLGEIAGLHPEIVRLGHVGPDHPSRQNHLSVSLMCLRHVAVNPPSVISSHVRRRVKSAPAPARPGDAPTMADGPGSTLSLRVHRAGGMTLPIASLRLGHQHYAIDLCGLSPVSPHLLVPIYARSDAGADAAPAASAPGDLPGSRVNRGVFVARLVAEYSPDGEHEILLDPALQPVRSLFGSWTYEHDFLILRLVLTPSQLELLRRRDGA